MVNSDTAPRPGGCRVHGSRPDHFFASAQA
jgi:hypothetical protein